MASRRSGPGGPDFPLRCRASRRHTSRPLRAPPTAQRRSLYSTMHATVVPAKPWAGVRRQRHCVAPRNPPAALPRSAAAPQGIGVPDMADVLFTNVRVFDGGGEAPFMGDVLVQGNKISRVVKTAFGQRTPPIAG